MRARIVGTGRGLPEKILTNADLEALIDTNDEWITTRTGIKERRMAAEDESLSDFAVPAAQGALEMAGVDAADIDLVICATVTPDMYFPATATVIQHRIGASRAAGFDISAACTGFIFGMGIAKQFIESGAARNILVVGAEVLTKYIDWTDRGTCVLFGDGAGAVLMQAQDDDDQGVLSVSMHSDGAYGDLIYRPGGGSLNPPSKAMYEQGLEYIKMKGNETFKVAVRSLAEVSNQALEECGLEHEDVSWFIPHQANMRIIKAVGQRLEIPDGRTYVNVQRYGNTSAASIPIALDELNREGKIDPGNVLLFSAFGSGLTWGASVVRW
jgi:3-oxoacyl-[acyl-carrier-protein] synthase-3